MKSICVHNNDEIIKQQIKKNEHVGIIPIPWNKNEAVELWRRRSDYIVR